MEVAWNQVEPPDGIVFAMCACRRVTAELCLEPVLQMVRELKEVVLKMELGVVM